MEQIKLLLNKYWYPQDTKTKIAIGTGIFITFSYATFKYLTNKPKIYKKLLEIESFIDDQIWTRDYPFHLIGHIAYARCTVIRLSNGKYLVHSPSPMDDKWITFFQDKEIEYIVAPGNFHWLYVAEWNNKYPKAKVLITPGVEFKAYNLKSEAIYGILHDNYVDMDEQSVLNKDFEFVLVRGFSVMNETAMFHKVTKTLILLDSMEYKTPKHYDYMNRMDHLTWFILGMHNKPLPSPSYQMSLKYGNLAKESFENILKWNFNKIIINHGENVDPQQQNRMNEKEAIAECKRVCRECWKLYL